MVLQYFQRSQRIGDISKRLKSQIWSSVVTVVIIDGKNLGYFRNEASNPFIKFRLSTEKFRSRTSLVKSTQHQWGEQFDLHMFDDQSKLLDVEVRDALHKDELIGK